LDTQKLGFLVSKEKYQISEKAKWLRLRLLMDELDSYKCTLQLQRNDIDAWNQLLRHTRNIFITLHNVSDELGHIHFKEAELIKKRRALAKKLKFTSHVRNRGVGHLNETMSERAVQWMPQLFTKEGVPESGSIGLAEAQRAVIESCVNSYVDKLGVQKQFGTEIDLLYPPNQRDFFEYMESTVKEAHSLLAVELANLDSSIVRRSGEDARELHAVAGKTEFDLRESTELSFSEVEGTEAFAKAIAAMEEMGEDERAVALLRELQKSVH
jgi:hypothetical protein